MEENKQPENPQAFPMDYGHEGYRMEPGMSLRDYFAAKAMQAMNNSLEMVREMYKDKGNLSIEDYIAKESYKMADAMLKTRLL